MRQRKPKRSDRAIGADVNHGMGGGSALLQAAVTTTLAAGALDTRFAAAGLVATLLVACKNPAVALFVAIIHLTTVIALVPNASDLPVISVGLLGGMLLTPWAVSAVLTWSVAVVASVITVYELGVSLWFSLIPVGLVSILLAVTTYGLRSRKFESNKAKHEDPEAGFVQPTKSPRRKEAFSGMFV